MRKETGFTFVELIVIIVIIAVIIIILIPRFSSLPDKARENITRENLQRLRTLIYMYEYHNNQFPQTLDNVDPDGGGPLEAFTPKYIKEMPVAMLKKTLGNEGQYDNAGVAYGPGPPAPDVTTGGWLYDRNTGQLWINHSAMDSKDELAYSKY